MKMGDVRGCGRGGRAQDPLRPAPARVLRRSSSGRSRKRHTLMIVFVAFSFFADYANRDRVLAGTQRHLAHGHNVAQGVNPGA